MLMDYFLQSIWPMQQFWRMGYKMANRYSRRHPITVIDLIQRYVCSNPDRIVCLQVNNPPSLLMQHHKQHWCRLDLESMSNGLRDPRVPPSQTGECRSYPGSQSRLGWTLLAYLPCCDHVGKGVWHDSKRKQQGHRWRRKDTHTNTHAHTTF